MESICHLTDEIYPGWEESALGIICRKFRIDAVYRTNDNLGAYVCLKDSASHLKLAYKQSSDFLFILATIGRDVQESVMQLTNMLKKGRTVVVMDGIKHAKQKQFMVPDFETIDELKMKLELSGECV